MVKSRSFDEMREDASKRFPNILAKLAGVDDLMRSVSAEIAPDDGKHIPVEDVAINLASAQEAPSES